MASNSKDNLESISGKLIKIRVERDNWFAGEIYDGTRNVPICTPVPCIPSIGSILTLKGAWEDTKYGKQFKAKSADIQIPDTREGVLGFLQTVPNIGQVRARLIVDRLGADAIKKMIADPSCIKGIGGLGEKQAEVAVANLRERKNMIEAEAILAEMGFGMKTRQRIAKEIGDDLRKTIDENPYRLLNLEGVTLYHIDSWVLKTNRMTADDPMRVAAVIVEALKKQAEQGHTWADAETIIDGAKKINLARPVPYSALPAGIDKAIEENMVTTVPNGFGLKPLVQAENNCFYKLTKLLSENSELGSLDLIDPAQLAMLTIEQRSAVNNAIKNRVSGLTGGPGTGKTFTSKTILAAFPNSSIAVVAPTGKAAKRAAEVTGYQASTIHRFIGSVKSALAVDSPKPIDKIIPQVFLVDEASMVDIQLFSQFLTIVTMRKDARIIIVGDVDQLPSIGAGRVLGDLIECGKIPFVRLTQVMRQAGESAIVSNAYRINNGEMPNNEKTDKGDWLYGKATAGKNEDQVNQIIEWLKAFVTKRVQKMGFDPIKDVQILTGQRRTALGTQNLNNIIRETINPPSISKAEIRSKDGVVIFREGDKVMFTTNDYDLGVVNGDQGIITRIKDSKKISEREVEVLLDSGERVIAVNDQIDDIVQAWVITVHKSQGSEYPIVVTICHDTMPWALQRALLYTAVTRGKKQVVVFGNDSSLQKAVKGTTPLRMTRLGTQLANWNQEVT
jgi:exodeoxyribonuclease V alpha subunit